MSHKCVLSLYALQLKVKGFVYYMKYYHMIELVYIVKHLSFYQREDKKNMFVDREKTSKIITHMRPLSYLRINY